MSAEQCITEQPKLTGQQITNQKENEKNKKDSSCYWPDCYCGPTDCVDCCGSTDTSNSGDCMECCGYLCCFSHFSGCDCGSF